MDDLPEPRNLRFLRRLVTVLTAVMIGGVLVIIALLVIRLQTVPASLTLPEQIALPEGTIPLAYTRGPDWFAITTADAILIFAPDGTLRQTVSITRN